VDAGQLKRYEGDIRETLVNRTLLLQQAKSLGIDVKDSLVTKALGEFKAAFKDEADYQQCAGWKWDLPKQMLKEPDSKWIEHQKSNRRRRCFKKDLRVRPTGPRLL
jgi:hypothetical protein